MRDAIRRGAIGFDADGGDAIGRRTLLLLASVLARRIKGFTHDAGCGVIACYFPFAWRGVS